MSKNIRVFVVSPDTQSERIYPLSLTVAELKCKLVSVTGIPADSQLLILQRVQNESQSQRLEEDEQQLGFYGLEDGMLLKVIDTDPSSNMTGQFGDVTLVEKFELSPEEYEKRTDTVRAYKQQHKLGRFAPSLFDSAASSANDTLPTDITVGSRCQIRGGEDSLQRRGTVRFVGQTMFGKQDGSFWVGVELDEPLGKNDGSVQGQRYFECLPHHGVFVQAANVGLGDYPPIESLDEEM